MPRLFITVFLSACLAVSASAQKKEQGRIENAGLVMKEILAIPEGIPRSLLAKAPCVVVIPSVLKFAVAVGGSFGFQAGGQATDFVLLLMNKRAASAILSSKVKLGADASAAAGPVGRH